MRSISTRIAVGALALLIAGPAMTDPLTAPVSLNAIGAQGVVRVKWTAFNQRGEPVYTFTPIGVVPRRPSGSTAR